MARGWPFQNMLMPSSLELGRNIHPQPCQSQTSRLLAYTSQPTNDRSVNALLLDTTRQSGTRHEGGNLFPRPQENAGAVGIFRLRPR